jgi:hypothetical protein
VSSAARAIVRLLVFTGVRLNEILTLRWDHVDLERGWLNLADSKTGAKTIYLNGLCHVGGFYLSRAPTRPTAGRAFQRLRRLAGRRPEPRPALRPTPSRACWTTSRATSSPGNCAPRCGPQTSSRRSTGRWPPRGSIRWSCTGQGCSATTAPSYVVGDLAE